MTRRRGIAFPPVVFLCVVLLTVCAVFLTPTLRSSAGQTSSQLCVNGVVAYGQCVPATQPTATSGCEAFFPDNGTVIQIPCNGTGEPHRPVP